LALFDLKKVADESTRTARAAELEAVHLAVSSRPADEVTAPLRVIMESLAPTNFETALARVRESLQLAMS